MNLNTIKPLTATECEEITGGFWGALLVGSLLLLQMIPTAKSLWNSDNGSVKVPGGLEAKWEKNKNISKETNDFKRELNKIETKIARLIPPFYEF